MSTRSVFLAILLVGCSAPTTVVRPSPATPTTVSVGVESPPKPCLPTDENHFGSMMNLDYAKFVCLGTTRATCYKEQPISQVACGRQTADQMVRSSVHCQLPPQAKSFLVVQGSYTELTEVVAGYRSDDEGERVISICGTPLPKE